MAELGILCIIVSTLFVISWMSEKVSVTVIFMFFSYSNAKTNLQISVIRAVERGG